MSQSDVILSYDAELYFEGYLAFVDIDTVFRPISNNYYYHCAM